MSKRSEHCYFIRAAATREECWCPDCLIQIEQAKEDPLKAPWTAEEREIADAVIERTGAFGLAGAALQGGAVLGVRLLRERQAA